MRAFAILAALLLGIIITACAPRTVPNRTPPPPSETLAPATVTRSASTATTGQTPVARALTAAATAITVSPTETMTPTITPTPGPPTATPTPAPGEATLEAAQNVDQALIAFAQAAATGDTRAILQAQQKLLDAATNAETVAGVDQTQYGQALRSALDAVQAAAGGDYDKLNEAHRALAQIAGANATPIAVIPRPAGGNQQSLTDIARSLASAVDAYVKANDSGTRDDLLRAQRDLLAAAANAEAATRNVHSATADQIQKALTAIHDGLSGDTGKFRDAAVALGAVTSANGAPSAVAAQPVDLQPLQNDLDNRLQALQNELGDQNKDNLTRAQSDLRDAVQKASDAIANDHSPRADRFRDALGTVQTVAGGDFTKIQEARDKLRAALSAP